MLDTTRKIRKMMGLHLHGTFGRGMKSNVFHSAEACHADRDKGHLGLDELESSCLVWGLPRGEGPQLGSAVWSEQVEKKGGFHGGDGTSC